MGRLPPPVNGNTPPRARVDETPPSELVGADEEDPPTALVVVSSLVVVVAPDVEVAPEVDVAPEVEVAPDVEVAPEVLVAPDVEVAPLVVVDFMVVVVVVPEVVVVVGLGTQPVTQNTLCLTSAPWEPSALIVSLTWKPCTGCGVMPVKSRV